MRTAKLHQDPTIVFVSFCVGFLGSYVAICLCEQLRSSYLHGEKSIFHIRMKWLLSIGMSFGGAGMWCMHFIGLSSVEMRDSETHEKIEMAFNSGYSFFTLALVVLTTSLGVYIASNDRLFAKSKAEILEMFITDSSHMSMVEIRKIKDSKIIRLISTKQLGTLFGGAFISAAGIIFMHYIGMKSMEFGEGIKIQWQWPILIISLIVAIIALLLGFWVLFRLLSIFPMKESLRLGSSLVLGGAVCVVHYIGMQGAIFVYKDPDNTFTNRHMNSDNFTSITLAAFIVLWVLAIVIFSDLRRLVNKYRNYILQQAHGKGDSRNPVSGSYLERILKESNLGSKVKPSVTHENTPANATMRVKRNVSNSSMIMSPRFQLKTIHSSHIDISEKFSNSQYESTSNISPKQAYRNSMIRNFESFDTSSNNRFKYSESSSTAMYDIENSLPIDKHPINPTASNTYDFENSRSLSVGASVDPIDNIQV